MHRATQDGTQSLHNSSVLHRSLLSDYPVATDGDGVYLIDSSGKAYLDACGGAAVSCLGHSDQALREAIATQLNRLAYAHSGFFTTQPMEELADDLIEHAPDGFSHVYFVSGGSEAVESALKLARQYYTEIGETILAPLDNETMAQLNARVSFDGEPVSDLGRRVVPGQVTVTVDERPVRVPDEFRIYAFHKPLGVVSTLRAQGGQLGLDLREIVDGELLFDFVLHGRPSSGVKLTTG